MSEAQTDSEEISTQAEDLKPKKPSNRAPQGIRTFTVSQSRSAGQELYYLLPLFANPKYILDEHHFSLINEYHYVKDYNIPLGKSLNETDALKLDYFTIIKNELASVIRHKQEKDGRSKS